jgi:hypothetical protein
VLGGNAPSARETIEENESVTASAVLLHRPCVGVEARSAVADLGAYTLGRYREMKDDVVLGVGAPVNDGVVDELGDEQPKNVPLIASEEPAELLDDGLTREGSSVNVSWEGDTPVLDNTRKPVVPGQAIRM